MSGTSTEVVNIFTGTSKKNGKRRKQLCFDYSSFHCPIELRDAESLALLSHFGGPRLEFEPGDGFLTGVSWFYSVRAGKF